MPKVVNRFDIAPVLSHSVVTHPQPGDHRDQRHMFALSVLFPHRTTGQLFVGSQRTQQSAIVLCKDEEMPDDLIC
jgi:hypothetical protein